MSADLRIRPIALPAEHGSWGLVVEPIVLGLLVAPSLSGLFLGLGAFAVFLTRRPLKVVLASRQRADSARLTVAVAFVLGYGAAAVLGFAATFAMTGWPPLLPMVVVSPLALVFLAYDVNNQSRAWQAELAGSVIFAMVATSIAIAGGWIAAPALALTGVLVARAIPSILYVRNRIRLDRKRPYNRPVTIAAHAVALALVGMMVQAQLLPWLVLLPFFALLVRAVVGLSGRRHPATPKNIGLTELGYGLATLLILVVCYWTSLP
ncbi:MAG TPA: YwiC-like family protein [Candidatus Acidoferrales bacterium]|nr:YwiC-like family protein [Candidatus Acidoferrales bacterium]